MKCLLDKNSIYDFKKEYINDLNIYYIDTDTNESKVIGKIISIKELPDDYLDIRYKITDKEYQYGQGKNVSIHFVKIENHLGSNLYIFQAEVKERKQRKRTKNNDTTMTLRVNKDVLLDFKIICEVMGTKPSRMLNKFMRDYIKENDEIVKEALTNKIVNNKKEMEVGIDE